MKVLAILMLLLLPQILLASEIRGNISTKYEIKNSGRIIIKNKENEKIEEKIEVKGTSFYEDNTLLRHNKKIYIIENQMRRHIRTLEELFFYRGQEIVDVEEEEVNKYIAKEFKNGDLMRGSDMRVYVVAGKNKSHVLNLENLRDNYFGQVIFNVRDSVILKFILI